MRLAKYLAHAGVASRRAAELIIEAGRVRVDGSVVRDPAYGVPDPDAGGPGARVEVDGEAIAGPEQRVVYMLNKPTGVLSTAHDPRGRPTVVELIDDERRLYPVGRLDADTSGLILVTNDGALAHRLMHPSFEVPKTYRAEVRGRPGARALASLRDGVALEDGPTAPAEVRRVGPQTLEITIREGRNRQVRRMLEAVGHPVIELERVGFGSLALGRLPRGVHRRLRAPELAKLIDEAR